MRASPTPQGPNTTDTTQDAAQCRRGRTTYTAPIPRGLAHIRGRETRRPAALKTRPVFALFDPNKTSQQSALRIFCNMSSYAIEGHAKAQG